MHLSFSLDLSDDTRVEKQTFEASVCVVGLLSSSLLLRKGKQVEHPEEENDM